MDVVASLTLIPDFVIVARPAAICSIGICAALAVPSVSPIAFDRSPKLNTPMSTALNITSLTRVA